MRKLFDYLEYRFCVPEFAGWMLIMLSGFFFAAATNTLSGWLYVISGVSFAVILISGILPRRVIKDIQIVRSPLEPVSAGDAVAVELTITNVGKTEKSLFEVLEFVPVRLLGELFKPEGNADAFLEMSPVKVIEQLAPLQKLSWVYILNPRRRGIFLFLGVDLVTASPFGLFRSRRSLTGKQIEQKLIVYPQVLTLGHCPLIDQMGADETPKIYSQRNINTNANEGLTKALRPYRWGDPTRLIHWRSSAKLGELKIRELEITMSGQDLVIALDTELGWKDYQFEEAVVAAASLYFYAQGVNLNVKLWTSAGGLIQGQQIVLETLAGIDPRDSQKSSHHSEKSTKLPETPLVWLTHQRDSLASLSPQSRWLLWQEQSGQDSTEGRGLVIESDVSNEGDRLGNENNKNQFQNLRSQLQRQIRT
jgi:uncharacterized protein (DUF58 family)